MSNDGYVKQLYACKFENHNDITTLQHLYLKEWFKFRRLVQKSKDIYTKSMITKLFNCTCIYLYEPVLSKLIFV